MDKNEVDQLKKSAILAEKDRTVQPENEEEESDDDAIDPKLERILKICSGVVAVIIVLVVILLIGKVAGWWGGDNRLWRRKSVQRAERTEFSRCGKQYIK